MGVKRGDAPDYFWFQPLRTLYEVAGDYSPQYQFWAPLIGASEGQDLIKTADFCSTGPPFVPDWTLESLADFGTEEVLKAWAQNEMYLRYCQEG